MIDLENAEKWIRFALQEGAEWIVLPELFSSGNGYDPSKMLDAHRPVEGEPMQMLKRLAKEGDAAIGGSFLAESGNDVYNTFALVLPDGQTFTHDKDFPSTAMEISFYAGGEDDEFVRELSRHGITTPQELIPARPDSIETGVFPLQDVTVGVAMCWELVRYRTARRLRDGAVNVVLAGSNWAFIDSEIGLPGHTLEALQQEHERWLKMIRQAPIRLARMLGAPVIHANTVGDCWVTDVSDGKTPVLFRYLGESQIVDACGKVLARRSYADGEGLTIADVRLHNVKPSEAIPEDTFWIPEMTEWAKLAWYNGSGREYYLNTARPHRNK